jgi:hypothetical protein
MRFALRLPVGDPYRVGGRSFYAAQFRRDKLSPYCKLTQACMGQFGALSGGVPLPEAGRGATAEIVNLLYNKFNIEAM